jgi:hypothetical protein
MGLVALENTGRADVSVMLCAERGLHVLCVAGEGTTQSRLEMSGLGRDETPLRLGTFATGHGELGAR